MLLQPEYKNGYDTVAKALIIGDSGVGKTCLTLRFCENYFVSQYFTTIGVDFKLKSIEIDNKKIKLQIWDTACQDRFTAVTRSCFAGAKGIIFAYACNDRDSFKNVENWIVQARKLTNEKTCLFLAATKCDVDDRTVTYDEGQLLAERYGMEFFETSSKEGTNVRTLFYCVAQEITQRTSLVETENSLLAPLESKAYKITKRKARTSSILPDWINKICCSG